MKLNEAFVKLWLEQIRQFCNLYSWLGNCFVLDHYTDSHWSKLPLSWRSFLSGLSPVQLHDWITSGAAPGKIAPLSLLSFRTAVTVLSIDRRWIGVEASAGGSTCTQDMDVKIIKLLQRHVKPKKRHEIEHMSKLVMELSAAAGDVKNLVDIGSGLGHLCRFMSFGLGFNTIGIDGNSNFGPHAKEFNQEVAKELRKKQKRFDTVIADRINPDRVQSEHMTQVLKSDDCVPVPALEGESYGLIGLHGCGDLGGIIIQNFVLNPSARFLTFVSCCYMKIKDTYPMSNYVQKNPIPFAYEPLELACHAREVYLERLKQPEEVDKLKTHCYRATLETIVRRYGFVREGLSIKGIKNYHHMDFAEYAVRACEKLKIRPTDEEIQAPEIKRMLEDWLQVVYFYTLRVMTAPVIETAVLLDRALFIIEHDYDCELRPIFDPVKSPRNTAIIGLKRPSLKG